LNDAAFRVPAIHYRLSAIGYQLSAISYQLFAKRYWLSAIREAVGEGPWPVFSRGGVVPGLYLGFI
jgi:hypothetical protein